MTKETSQLPDDLNPEIVKATAIFVGQITGMVPPPHDAFPSAWHGHMRAFTKRLYEIAGENTPTARTVPRFPTMLRKMWSGTEVQQWLDENIAALAPSDAAGAPVGYVAHDAALELQRGPRQWAKLFSVQAVGEPGNMTPLYAAPVAPAAPLTDEQIEAFANDARQHEAGEFSGTTKVASHDNVVWAIRRALRAAPTTVAPAAVAPEGWALVPTKITDEMIEAAIAGHYGKRRAQQAGGATGIVMTVNGMDYSGVDAMRRFWKGALSAAPTPTVAADAGVPLTADERTAILHLCRLYLDDPEKRNAKAVLTRIFSVAATAAPPDDGFRQRVERLLVELHNEDRLSEGQCAKVLDIDRISWRKIADDAALEHPSARAPRFIRTITHANEVWQGGAKLANAASHAIANEIANALNARASAKEE